jgi:hypothetical protein
VKLARFRKPKATCLLSYVEQRPNTNTSITHTKKHTQSMYPKARLAEKTKGGRKEGKKGSKQ